MSSQLTVKQKLQRYFMSDKKRYGLKYDKEDRIFDVMGCVISFIGLGFLVYSTAFDSINYQYAGVGLGLILLGFAYIFLAEKGMFKRRIRELGGDILHPKDKGESK